MMQTVAVASCAVMALAACSHEGPAQGTTAPASLPGGPSESESRGVASPTSGTGAALPPGAASEYRAFEYGKPVATGKTTIGSARVSATVEVMRLSAGKTSTVVVLRIVPTGETGLGFNDLGAEAKGAGSYTNIALVDSGAKKLYRPGRILRGQKFPQPALTSRMPDSCSPEEPCYLHLMFGPLPESLSTVAVRIPHMSDITAPVSRV